MPLESPWGVGRVTRAGTSHTPEIVGPAACLTSVARCPAARLAELGHPVGTTLSCSVKFHPGRTQVPIAEDQSARPPAGRVLEGPLASEPVPRAAWPVFASLHGILVFASSLTCTQPPVQAFSVVCVTSFLLFCPKAGPLLKALVAPAWTGSA